MTIHSRPIVALAGGTGDIGLRVAAALVRRGAEVHAPVRTGAVPGERDRLASLGATVREVSFAAATALQDVCQGALCVVTTLNGLAKNAPDVSANWPMKLATATIQRCSSERSRKS